MKIIFLLAILVMAGCSNLLYYPTRYKYVDVELLKHKPEEIIFYQDLEKNEKLAGWYFQSPRKNVNEKPKAIIVLFHGNAQNISAHFSSLFWILDYNYDFFIFDYPGYGASHGEPTPQNTMEAGEKAIRFSQIRWPGVPLIIWGQSLGGAVSLSTVINAKQPIHYCAHVVESSFDSYKKVGQETLASSWLSWPFQWVAHLALSDEFAPSGKISKISPTPLLVVHRKNDPVVPASLGQRIYDEAVDPKRLLLLEGSGHIDSFLGADRVENRKYLFEFFQKSLKECSPSPL